MSTWPFLSSVKLSLHFGVNAPAHFDTLPLHYFAWRQLSDIFAFTPLVS